MRYLFPIGLLFSAGVLLTFGACATEDEESSQAVYEKELEAHVHVVHKDTLQKTASGLYYAPLRLGSGQANNDSAFVMVRETTYDLNYNITASTEEAVARQLGTYSEANHYAPLLLTMGNHSNMLGIEEMLLQMREGDKRRVWLPYWLSNYYEGGKASKTATTVYDLEIEKVITDMDRYQTDLLEAFRDTHYPGLDSLSKGFYMMKLVEGTGDTVAYEEKVTHIYYVGKYLDGHVFDTNHADTALCYSISASEISDGFTMPTKDYVTGLSTASEDAGSAVAGFSKCLMNMRYGDVAICFFNADLGYGSSGESGGSVASSFLNGGYSIPPYTPLFFWVYLYEDE